MTTYIRPSAVARDDADMLAGWNISPNTGYQLQISATSSGAVVILLSADGSTLIGSGVAAVGTAQPVTITPMSGQTLDMADANLGWHILLTTAGTEGDRTITMDAMVDLSARTHPVYADDDLALAVGTADINAGTHYTQDVVASCPLGFGATVGNTASVPVDGSAVVGQVESVTWAGTPDGSTAQAVIRAHIPIRPDAYTPPVVPTPPVVVDDAGTTDAATTTSGNVLANDSGCTLTVSAVNGISSNVGATVAGSNGGDFVVNADGSWTFDPAGDFSALTGSDTATTSVAYHASNGEAEASATLTVTVIAGAETLWDPSMITTALWLDAADSSTATIVDGKISQRSDKSGNSRHATQSTAGLRPVVGTNKDVYDGTDDRMTVPDSSALDSPKYVMVICKPTPSKDWAAVLEKWNSSAGWQIVYGGAATRTLPGLSVNSTTINAPAHVNNTIAVFEGQIDGSNSFFGTTASGFATGTLPAPTATTSVLWVGGEAGSSNVLAMDFHEVIVLTSVPDTATRQRLQGYASHKWDALLGVTTLVSALPSDHPYKSAAPTI